MGSKQAPGTLAGSPGGAEATSERLKVATECSGIIKEFGAGSRWAGVGHSIPRRCGVWRPRAGRA